ncbi:hypothetical protein BJ741DRAFT_597435 [Chytriomyces cf. hyalinus JEL632]|nr:hypothetical protein BJ741DRAFT_597435 [Chytriomyces cf. hyalinus JEL632]
MFGRNKSNARGRLTRFEQEMQARERGSVTRARQDEVPLPRSIQSSGFVNPSRLFFRRTSAGHIAIHTSAHSLSRPLFVLSTVNQTGYESSSVSDSALHRARSQSLLPIRVACPDYPTFAVDLILAAQSSFSSNTEFACADMYAHKFSLVVAQPPGSKSTNPVVASFSYHATEYIYSRTQLSSTMLSSYAYSGGSSGGASWDDGQSLRSLPRLPSSSAKNHFGAPSNNAFQMELKSRKRVSSFTKEKLITFGTAEASRTAFFNDYVSDRREDAKRMFHPHNNNKSQQSPTTFDSVYNNNNNNNNNNPNPASSGYSSSSHNKSTLPRGLDAPATPKLNTLLRSSTVVSSNTLSSSPTEHSSFDENKYPVFGAIHLIDESVCISEAEGLKELMILVGTVYATWSRSVLKPLDKLEYYHLNRVGSVGL